MSNINSSRRNAIKSIAVVASLPLLVKPNLFGAKKIPKTFKLIQDGEVLTAAHWGRLKLTVKNGKIIKSEPYEQVPKMKNPLQYHTMDLVYAKDRVKYPYVRKSYLDNPDSPKPYLRGKDEWVRVSYKKAIKLIADELKKTRKKLGVESVYAGSYGWESAGNVQSCTSSLKRFMNVTGGYTDGAGDYSTGASQVIMPHVMGTLEVYEQQTSWPLVLEHSKVVVIWGSNPLATLRLSWLVSSQDGLKYFEELKASGKKIIFIDPIKNETCQFLNARWIPITPNTDVTMMLAMMYELYTTKKYNKEFIADYTEGFDKFVPYLLGKTDKTPKTPKWAEKICGVDAKTIKELAHLFYENRTMFMSGWAMQRAHHGEQPHWALATLCSMIGQIGLPGGGFGLSYHYSDGGTPSATAGIVGGISAGSAIKRKYTPSKQPGVSQKIPVARIADAILNPGKTIDFNGKKVTYPKIDFIYWVGGNPVNQHQNLNNNLQAWRTPRTVVVNELFWTPTARMADIVMPATTSYERDDISMYGYYSNSGITPMRKVVEPIGESKDDYQIFRDLAREFGTKEEKDFSNGKNQMEWIEEFYNKARKQVLAMGLDKLSGVEMKPFKKFWEENKPVVFTPTLEGETFVRHADFREDPILNPLGTPSGLIEIYSETIAKMKYDDCHAHASWFEPAEWLGMKNKPAQFHMISPHPITRLHSQLNNTSLRDTYAINNREPIWINTQDAKKKGIKNGDVVRVFNSRGQSLAGAFVTDNISSGVIRLQEGAWYDPSNPNEYKTFCKNGCPNTLTLDIPTSKLANGNCSHTALVNIEKYKGKAPSLSIFKHPDPKA